MCFLKNVDREVDYDLLFSKFDNNTEELSSLNPLPKKISFEEQLENLEVPLPAQKYQNQEISSLLKKLSSRLNHNSQLIHSIFNKLQAPSVKFMPVQLIQSQPAEPSKIKDQILHKLFGEFDPEIGKKDFQYKLSLEKSLPKKLFKSKKVQCSVKLISSFSKNSVVQNYNPLDICVGVFDCQGNWITENLLGEPILEGITSVELLNGKADFNKIFLREISGNLPNKKFNLAIYVKPGIKSSIGVSSNNSDVNWKQIKPLLLRNLTVLSKNRKNLYDDQS